MDSVPSSPLLAAREIHGFDTLADLDIGRLLNEAQFRWFRPNEVHAMLTNSNYFKIQPQPLERPRSGSVLHFDRKVLRNFRQDGYVWKKKKDGKNVQEAHEKLKIGNAERVHVYYARSDEDTNFYRRSYWLLDKNLERIVLVHYRHTLEESSFPQPPKLLECQESACPYDNMSSYDSLAATKNFSPGLARSDLSVSAGFSEETNSGEAQTSYTVNQRAQTEDTNDHYLDALKEPHGVHIDLASHKEGFVPSSGQQWGYDQLDFPHTDSYISSSGISSFERSSEVAGFNGVNQASDGNYHTTEENHRLSRLFNGVNFQTQAMPFKSSRVDDKLNSSLIAGDVSRTSDSFGRLNCIDKSPGSLDCLLFDAPISSGDKSDAYRSMYHVDAQVPVFNIVHISPERAYSNVETEVIVVGCFNASHKHLSGSKIYCVFGETCVAAKMVHDGVYSCTTSSTNSGLVNFFLTLDGHTPISSVLSFEYLPIPSLQSNGVLNSSEKGNDKLKSALDKVQIRLAHLLFSSTNTMSVLSNKIQPKILKEAKRYESLTSSLVEKDWEKLLKVSDDYGSIEVEDLLELLLKNKLKEWLLLKLVGGCKITPHDSEGQGVIHLCAILDYAWAVRLFSSSGLSLDFRDAFGWTALHWAAYYGRENMAAALLSAGANPSLITDPTPENPGGSTVSDLASRGGYEGLAAYLAEKGLTAHFEAMSLSGNITSLPPQTLNNTTYSENFANLIEQEILLKESLAAYRTAADAADKIQAAFRERSLKQQTRAVQMANPLEEATEIISALRIQHAFRNYNRRRQMKAASHIQKYFRTWQARREFLNMRKHAIRIQAAYRGHQVRRQYQKLTWSVGVLEKAILRWRLKRKGLRGMQTEATNKMNEEKEEEEEDVKAEEDFFRIGREQAEERVKNSVVKVQAMFRSYQAQQEYRRMKLAHMKAKKEFMDGADGNP